VFPLHFADNAFGGDAISNRATTADNLYNCAAAGYEHSVYGLLEINQAHPVCNALGLTPLGRELVQGLARRKMIIDIDHMSARAFDDTVAATGNYPLVSGHTGFFELSRGNKKHEGNLRRDQVRTLYDRGGI